MIPLAALMMSAAVLAAESSQPPASPPAVAPALPAVAVLPALPTMPALPPGWEAPPAPAHVSGPSARDERRAQRRDRFFAEDKLMHFFTSFAATSLAASGARLVGFDARDSRRIGVATGAVLGVGKEIHDLSRPGETASVLDLIWDTGGVALGAVVANQVR
jgi:VanZ family protein